LKEIQRKTRKWRMITAGRIEPRADTSGKKELGYSIGYSGRIILKREQSDGAD
jgi:hypothetical protein